MGAKNVNGKAPYELDPKGSFERVAALQQKIKKAESEHKLRKSAALESKNQLDKLRSEISELIDGESDPRPSLFSEVIKANAAPTADLSKVNLDQIGLKKKDCEWLQGNGIATMGDLNTARLDKKLEELKPSKTLLKRIDKAVQDYQTAVHMGTVQGAPAAASGDAKPKRSRKKKPPDEPAAS